MKVKWSKKIAIEYVTEMRSPQEEQMRGRMGGSSVRDQIAQKFRQTILRNRQPR